MTTVAHIITALGSGGAERMLVRVASRPQAEFGARQVVICLGDEGYYGVQLREAGVEVHCLGMRPRRISAGALVRLVALLRRLKPDLVMTWLYHADLIGTLAGRLAGVPRIVWNLRCSDIDFSRYSPVTRWTAWALARLSRVPTAVAYNSIAGRRSHERLGYRPRHWVYLPNGYDCDEWKPDPVSRADARAELGYGESDFVVGMVARVDPQKDHATFFAAMSKVGASDLSRARILLVGRDTETLEVPDVLRPVTMALGERRDVKRLMGTLDVLVSTSAYGEGFPNVLGEAMASGVPCVATDSGDSALVIGDGGRIVPVEDATALADAIARLIRSGPDERARLSRNARERIQRTFSAERCYARYAQIFTGDDERENGDAGAATKLGISFNE
jgi:glycosyltransferase involved in cell wall biosynthesis